MVAQRTGLVTGATGYVGGLVVEQLLRGGWRVKILARNEEKALARSWGDEVEIVEGDAAKRDDVARALEGADCAWYLLHSMDDGAGFAQEEADMARRFGEEAKRAGVGRIVYLGGLHPQGENMSEHLASRVRVGEILMDSGVPTAVLQAGVVIGDGSLSFQLLRHVTERVPAFVAPEWITNEITPIGARDIAFYLVAAADLPAEMNRTFDVGGPDSMPYVEMMQRYAEAVGLHRRPYFTAPIMTRALAAWGWACSPRWTTIKSCRSSNRSAWTPWLRNATWKRWWERRRVVTSASRTRCGRPPRAPSQAGIAGWPPRSIWRRWPRAR